jgi:hypothetical protein
MPYSDSLRDPDVEVQTVFRDVGVGVPHLFSFKARKIFVPFLIAAVGQSCGVQDTVPRIDRNWTSEAKGSHGGLCEWYSGEYVNLFIHNEP